MTTLDINLQDVSYVQENLSWMSDAEFVQHYDFHVEGENQKLDLWLDDQSSLGLQLAYSRSMEMTSVLATVAKNRGLTNQYPHKFIV